MAGQQQATKPEQCCTEHTGLATTFEHSCSDKAQAVDGSGAQTICSLCAQHRAQSPEAEAEAEADVTPL